MSKSKHILMAILTVISILPLNMVIAADATPVISKIDDFGPYFDRLSNFEEFGKTIPMSTISPGEALSLASLFSDSFNYISTYSGDFSDPIEIDSITYADVSILLSEMSESMVTMQLEALHSMPLPIRYVNNPEEDPNAPEAGTCLDSIDNDDDNLTDGDDPDCAVIFIDGGEVQNADFVLTAQMTFGLDGDTIYLQGEPTISLTYDTGNGVVEQFFTRYGFADISVEGTALYKAKIDAKLIDENKDEKIFTSDWDNTILVDLVTMDYASSPSNDVNIQLTLSSLLENGGSGILSLVIPDLNSDLLPEAGFNAEPALSSFTSVGPDDMLTGLASYAYALNTVWVVNEGNIPFVKEKLHNQFMPGESLLDLVRRQGDALVMCGTEPTIPPTGNPDAGGTVYCQAFTSQNPSAVAGWKISGSAILTFLNADGSSADVMDTVGIQPTAWAVVDTEPGAWKNIEVEFNFEQDEANTSHIAEPRVRTVNELKAKLEQTLGGPVPVSFSADSHTLIYDIAQSIDPNAGSVQLAFGSTLRAASGVTNIQDSWTQDNEYAADRAEMNIGTVDIHAGFGTILVPDVADISFPTASTEVGDNCSNGIDDDGDDLIDSYDPDCPQKEDRFFMDLPANGHVISVGGLDVVVPLGYSMPGTIGALGVDVAVSSFSITSSSLPFAADLTPIEISINGLAPVPNAVGVKDLIANPTAGGGFVTRSQSIAMNGSLIVSSQGLDPVETGTISISWDDTSDPVLHDVSFDNPALKAFDLYDPASQSENPQALVTLILDSLYNRASAMYNQEDAGKSLPVIGMSMRDLAPQFKNVMDAAVAIKTGKSVANISCEISIAENPDEDSMIECWAVSDLDPAEISDVEWRIYNLETDTPIAHANDADTIWPNVDAEGSKVQFIILDLADTQSLGNVSIELVINGNIAIQYPYQPPETLLLLKQTLAAKLQTAEENIAFSVSGPDLAGKYLLNVSLTLDGSNQTVPFPLQLSLSNPDIQTMLNAKEGQNLDLTANADFYLAYTLPLDPGITMDDVEFQSALIQAEVEVSEEDFDEIEATLGGYSIILGTLSPTSSARPALAVSTAPASYYAAGEIVELNYTVENSGGFTLSGPFTLNDPKFNPTCSSTAEKLKPGETFDCTANYQTQDGDTNEKSVASMAYATGNFGNIAITSPTTAISITNTAPLPRLELAIHATPELLGTKDSTITYTYTIKNIGNKPIDGSFSVDDDQFTVDCSAASEPLNVGEITTCTATHTITEAEADAGVLYNTATASGVYEGDAVSSASVTHQVVATANPSLSLEISFDPEHLFGMPGDNLQIDYVMTNTGNVSLTSPFEITDSHFGNTACPVPASGSLAPEESLTCEVDYPPSGEEWNAGQAEGSAKAKAKYGVDDVSSEPASASTSVTDVSKQAELKVAIRSVLSYNGPDWNWSLEGTDQGDDIVIHLAARMAGENPESLGILDYHTEATEIPSIPIPDEMSDTLNLQPLDITMLPLSLPELSELLTSNLDGDRWDVRMPMVGGNLAAGADIASVLEGWKTGLDALDVSEATEPSVVKSKIKTVVDDVIKDAVVKVYCDDDECTDENTISEITKVEITVTNFKKTEDEKKIPFATGLPGVPLEITSEKPLSANTDWTLNLVFGVERFRGPYVVQENELLTVNSTVTVAESACVNSTDADSLINENLINFTLSECRYMRGYIGLFPGTLYDGDGNTDEDTKSKVDLTTTINLSQDLTYADLLNGLGAQAPEASIQGNGVARINLLFITDKSATVPLPQVAGAIHLIYSNDEGYEEMSYTDIYMNIATFYQGFLGPALDDVRNYTKPLQPVVDTVTAPIPVISDLSTMVGQGTITLLTLLEAASGSKGVELIKKLATLITYINSSPEDTGGWIGLGPGEGSGNDPGDAGSFEISIEEAEKPECGEDNSGGDCESKAENKDKRDKDKDKKGNKSSKVERSASAEASWEGAGISLPILEDTGQIYDMLLGIDATLIYVDLGTLSASAGLEYSFGPFMVGPVPVSITLGGTVTLSGRFAMGYDTRGLRQLLRGESFTSDALIDGIYIDDLDANGNDVPEIVLEVEIYASASVSIKIFEAGIRAGVIFGVDLNWNDPNDDGKLRIDEIAMWMYKPICLFDRHGYIGFYLKFYLKIDLFLFTATIEWTALEKTYDLFNESCAPPQPLLGQVDGDRFRLNMGLYANARNLPAGPDEKFIVRQLTPLGQGIKTPPNKNCDDNLGSVETGTCISITFMGVYQEFIVPMGAYIYADAGSGNDTISLLPGVDKSNNNAEVPFDLDAELHGGPGNDQLDTGQGVDEVYGDSGNDIINTRSGDDTIVGGPEKLSPATGDTPAETDVDSLDGGIGNDIVQGGADRDVLNGGPGSDVMDGGTGDDSLSGGPGLPPGQTPDTILEDMADILIGGDGDDVVEGTFGRDYLFGDNLVGSSTSSLTDLRADPADWSNKIDLSAACLDESGTGRDNLVGGAEDDYLFGGGGDDQLQGEKGGDILCGNSGHDTLVGGTGNDKLNGGPDDDDLMGGDGQDELEGGAGNDILLGDTLNIENHPLTDDGNLADHPTITSQPVSFVLPMNESLANWENYNDILSGGPGTDFIFGEIGKDHLYGDGALTFAGTWASDGDGSSDYMEGNANDDHLYGTNGSDYMLGGQGNDTMYGGFEDDSDPNSITDSGDKMWGNSGNDKMWGNAGNDQMNGNTGNDTIEGNSGQDTIHGGPDTDWIIGGSSQAKQDDIGDYLYGDEDADWITGDNAIINESGVTLLDVYTPSTSIDAEWYGGDFIFGNDGDDHIWGQGGEDKIEGGTGNDYIEGNHAKDEIFGNAGHDVILGGSNPRYTGMLTDDYIDTRDDIYGGAGEDIITGDNARIVNRTVILLNVETELDGIIPDLYGDDLIYGDEGDDKIWGQGGEDEIDGGEGDDYIEGNHASDLITGGDGDDDILGGSSPVYAGDVPSSFIDTSTKTRTVPLGQNPAVEVPLGDTIYGGNGADYVLGDNGTINRPGGTQTYELEIATFGDIAPLHQTGITRTRALREVQMLNPAPGITAGSDLIYGGTGEDELYGQFDDTGKDYPAAIGDEVWGMEGQDMILGDQGTADSSILGGISRSIRSNPPFLKDVILLTGTLHWMVNVDQTIGDGNDRLSGGSGSDFIHAGGGSDLLNGNDGNDRLFGDDGDDAIWGGTDHDHLWGGNGADFMDVLPRTEKTEKQKGKIVSYAADPFEWFTWATISDYAGIDYMYGGAGKDAMQADVAPTGPAAGDRMIDWIGVYNIYYLCGPQYGEYAITRSPSPSVINFLVDLAIGDGAVDPGVTGSSGFDEIAIVYTPDFRTNSHPPHPDTPGHFTCP